MTYWTVPRLWPGETIVCIGGGPSLTLDDVNACRGRARVIAVNNAFQLAPWADLLYACGKYPIEKGRWWKVYPTAVHFKGLKVTLDEKSAQEHGLHLLHWTGDTGLELEDRTGVRGGFNSGYQAVNLAVHLGATRILLLGYDMQRGPDDPTEAEGCRHHWHGNHPHAMRPPYDFWIDAFGSLPEALAAVGVEVINCTRVSALTVFPRQPLIEALAWPHPPSATSSPKNAPPPSSAAPSPPAAAAP